MDINRRSCLINAGLVFVVLTASVIGSVAHAIPAASDIKQLLNQGHRLTVTGIELRNTEQLYNTYSSRNFMPLWVRDEFPTHTSIIVAERLAGAHRLGLQPSRYYGRLLRQLSTQSFENQLIEFELLMTDSVISYLYDIAHGTTEPPPPGAGWHLQRARLDVGKVASEFFNGAMSLRDAVESLHPTSDRFYRLLNSLREYLAIAETGGWTVVSDGPQLAYGDRSPRVSELRQRLWVSGDISSGTVQDSELFDSDVLQALIQFQSRHGLETDGVLGPQSLKALNVPVEQRIEQINLNLDRWRWLSRDLGYSNIIVNTAGYDMTVTLNGSVAMNMNVIIGKPRHATPLFSDTMDHLVYNPSWFVPKSITRKLLHTEASNPGYLLRNNFEVRNQSTNLPVPFSDLTPFDKDPEFFTAKYWLRQLPGSDNALGNLKFMFPNKFSIYLHDTNTPELFEMSDRAFSHGCIRLEQPQQLAELLLAAEGKSAAEISHYQALDYSKKVRLSNKLPIHLTYQTAWVSDDGSINFRNDIYKHDNHTLAQLRSNETAYVQAETNALALSDVTLVSNTY